MEPECLLLHSQVPELLGYKAFIALAMDTDL
jgi:hypothetical protein